MNQQPDNLSTRTLNGTFWSFLDNVLNQGITFLVGLVLAHYISPEEYGLVGIIMIFVVLFNAVIDSGISSALIRNTNVTDIDYDTAFIANLVMGFAMFGLLFILAKPIALFFNSPQLTLLTRVMSFVLIVNALAIVQRTQLTKRIDFKTQTKISAVSSVFSGIIGISMAVKNCGVFSLIGQQISRQCIQTFMLWIWGKWFPKWRFSWKAFKSMFDYGWKITLSNIINSLWNEAYQVVIGRFYSASTLGQYTRAKQFTDICSSNLTTVIQRVTFPSLSEIQNDPIRLKNAYRRIIRVTVLFSFVLLFGMAAISDNLVYVLIGPQWTDAAKYLPIICFQCVFFPLSSVNLNILMVKGETSTYLYLEIAKRIIALLPLIVGALCNIEAMLFASVVYGIIAYFLNSYYSGRIISYTVREQIKDIIPALIIAILMAIIVYGLNFINISCFLQLPLQICVGTLVVLISLYLSKNEDANEILKLLKVRFL